MNEQILYDLQNRSEQHKREIESINQKINEFKTLVESCLSLRNLLNDFETFRQIESDNTKTLFTRTHSLKEGHDSVAAKIATLENIQQGFYSQIESFKESIARFEKQICSLIQRIDAQPFAEQIAIQRTDHERAKEAVAKELSTIRKDLIVAPSQIISSNQDLLNKLEAAQLDGSNAVLKANNLDTQMKLLERRFEALTLQVKKIELEAQAR